MTFIFVDIVTEIPIRENLDIPEEKEQLIGALQENTRLRMIAELPSQAFLRRGQPHIKEIPISY